MKEYCDSIVLCFTETWIHKDISDSNVSEDDFHILRTDRNCRRGKSKSGGLAILVKNSSGNIMITEHV